LIIIISICTAAGSTYLLEMAVLSRLTGEDSYEKAASVALKAIWNRRSHLNLIGSTIHTHTGKWLMQHTGIGAGIDSFYETLLKAGILTGDSYLLDSFGRAYDAVQIHTGYKV